MEKKSLGGEASTSLLEKEDEQIPFPYGMCVLSLRKYQLNCRNTS